MKAPPALTLAQAELLARAEACLAAGTPAEAWPYVEAVLTQAPRAPAALFIKGELHRRRGEFDLALRCFRRVEAAGVRSAPLCVTTGLALRAAGDVDGARRAFERALRLDPANADAHGNLARVHGDAGNLAAARRHGARALELAPDNALLRANLGALHLRARDGQAAWACLVADAPADFTAPRPLLLSLAAQLAEADDHPRATRVYRQLLTLDPVDADALNGLAQSQYMTGDYAAAREGFARLAAEWPDDPRGAYGLGAIARVLGEHAAAHAALRDALASLRRADAPREARQRVEVELGFAALAAGDLDAGWRHYGGRWYAHDPDPEATLAAQLWQGEPLAGRRLVVLREQGVGDEILFASMYPNLHALGERLVVQCSTRLADAFARSLPGIEWWPCAERPEAWQLAAARLAPDDRVVFAGSLPRWLRRTRDDFGAGAAYLQPDPRARATWRQRFAACGDGLLIGLSWRGGTAANFRGLRSLPLADLLEALAPALPPGAVLVDLQYDDRGEEIAACAHPLARRLLREDVTRRDFAATLDLIAALDLVITVQTAVAHVGGALGVPTWVLVPQAPTTVRWLPEHGRTPWYRSVRLFTQSQAGDWTSALHAVAHTLRAAGPLPQERGTPC